MQLQGGQAPRFMLPMMDCMYQMRPNCVKRQSATSRQTHSMCTILFLRVFFTLGNLSVEELMHLGLNHLSLQKLVKLNGRVDGLPRKLSNKLQGKFQCHTCQDATA